MPDEAKTDFYRPTITAEVREMSYSTAELEHRKDLTDAIVANLRIIDQHVGLELAAERISSLATAAKIARELASDFERDDDEAANG